MIRIFWKACVAVAIKGPTEYNHVCCVCKLTYGNLTHVHDG